jgi:hypothetical protein
VAAISRELFISPPTDPTFQVIAGNGRTPLGSQPTLSRLQNAIEYPAIQRLAPCAAGLTAQTQETKTTTNTKVEIKGADLPAACRVTDDVPDHDETERNSQDPCDEVTHVLPLPQEA